MAKRKQASLLSFWGVTPQVPHHVTEVEKKQKTTEPAAAVATEIPPSLHPTLKSEAGAASSPSVTSSLTEPIAAPDTISEATKIPSSSPPTPATLVGPDTLCEATKISSSSHPTPAILVGATSLRTESIAIPSPPCGATSQASPAATQPFAKLELYVCPYMVLGRCTKQIYAYNTLKKLIAHVDLKHAGDGLATSYEENPLEDGTRKIPCPRGCEHMSSTHQQANHHAKIKCTKPLRTQIACPWPDCNMQITGFNAEHGMANHIRHKHSKDTRGPYQCSKDGCEYFHVCLYKLAAHEEKCKAVSAIAKEEHASLRFKLNKAAMDNQPPTFIVVNRSSSHAPEEWKAGTGDIKTGLPFVGKQILAHFAAKCGLSSGAAVLHSSYECQTRKIPALAHDLSYLETQNHQKKMVWRGFKFTQAIVNDITVANNAGIKPFLISQGLDGWACDVRMIHPWLQATKLQFELVIKTNALQFGLDSTFAEQHGGVFWWHHNPQDILQALEDGHGNNPKADQLIASWRICQSHKDGQFGVKKRRNFVDMSVSYPALD